MKRWNLLTYWLCGLVTLCLLAIPATALEVEGDFEIDEAEATVITSKRLTFDQTHQYALFEEDVVVVDASMRLTADRLAVFFDENNQADMIEAVGNVVMKQEDTTAWARKATYSVEAGTIFLEGSPRIQRGRDVLEGDTITFWREDNRMICEPRARLVLFPDEGGSRDFLWGE